MSTYYQIFGGKVNVLSSDPANFINGQVWYNSTDKVIKYNEITTAGAWATGGNLNTARSRLGGAGTQTAGLAFGGQTTVTVTVKATEEYNGSSWTAGGNLATARMFIAGCGT